ncbi:glutathione transferase GST 23-like [Telopea speciosissima]|uniref:glutathione transferase GST 23-like n=1 Tax=Telopea speciosissima TaxID=54955 RepID=UPI001CC35F83|nr:glutathione transferase GST 23-like [Telopea speciosissima]
MGHVKLLATSSSPPCRRIEWALKLKGVEYEYIEEDLANKSPLLLQCNPVHKKVPVLIHDEKPIAESFVILEYIDESWEGYPLLPVDPYQRAMARFWAKFADEKSLIGVWQACCAQGEEQEKAVESALETLKILEKKVEGKKFFGGEKIGFLDIVMGWIPLWLNALEEVGGMKLLDAESLPLLHEWSQNFIQVPVIKENLPPKEKVISYFQFGRDYMLSLAANK